MIKIFSIVLLLSISLFARLNPFEPDLNYTPEEKIEKKSPLPVEKPIITKDDGNRTIKVEGTDTKSLLVKEASKKVQDPKVIIKEKIVKVKPTKEELAALCKVEKVVPTIIEPKKKEQAKVEVNPILVKEKTKVIKHFNKKSHGIIPRTYKILPFVTIDTDYNSLKISSRPQYHIITYHALKGKRKIAFDFLADVWFYTRYKKLAYAPEFKSYTVGNHKKKGFFRVTIELKENIKNYTVTIKNNIATITHK
jgi:hypothetical protein